MRHVSWIIGATWQKKDYLDCKTWLPGWVLPKIIASNRGFYAHSSLWEVSSESRSGAGKSKTRKEGKPIQGCVDKLVISVGYWGSVLSRLLWRAVQNAPQNRSPERTKEGSISLPLVKVFPGMSKLPYVSRFSHESEWLLRNVLSITCTSGCWLLQQMAGV